MIVSNELEMIGEQSLAGRLKVLNALALHAARRTAAAPEKPSRIRLRDEQRAAYGRLSDGLIDLLAPMNFFLFRPTLIADALSYRGAPQARVDSEIVRRFLAILRDLSAHSPGTPLCILRLRADDRERARKLTDDDFERLQDNLSLCFHPRFEPAAELCSPVGWNKAALHGEVSRDLMQASLEASRQAPRAASLERP